MTQQEKSAVACRLAGFQPAVIRVHQQRRPLAQGKVDGDAHQAAGQEPIAAFPTQADTM